MIERKNLSRLFAASLVLVPVVLAAACERYEPPPTPTIVGLQDGLLFDSKQPLVIDFGQPVDLATLDFKVVVNQTNIEGDLGDEDQDPDTSLDVLFSRSPSGGDALGKSEFEADNARVRFTPEKPLPIGSKLLLVVEPGLKGTSGRERVVRTKIPFTYSVKCVAGRRSNNMKSGTYYALLDVKEPLGVQLQFYGVFDVDPATGAFIAQFTNADRNRDPNRCPTPCAATESCRLLPRPECVAPSTKAGDVTEYPDFVPNPTPPTGYTFAMTGCAVDDGNGAGVLTAPAVISVQSPAVTVQDIYMNAFFGPDAATGRIRASGSLAANKVFLGDTLLGKGNGTMTALLLDAKEVPADLPQPDKALFSRTDDGGAPDAGR
ncbi:MAG: hypothetical protein JST00_15755 [Deltaproteobacteria bacterium]|nr:hypothetical protein [Deltaproteobacteria bacterium]